MKALSIRPEFTMEIFIGEKTIEYRTWQTDYRGDLLICASSHKEPGYVCGYAYMVIPLLDIKPDEELAYTDSGKLVTQYDWILGAPKLIQPIPIKGKLHLFDVDDTLIQYIDGGDLSAYPTKDELEDFRAKYFKDYLEPLIYRPAGYNGKVWMSSEPEFLPFLEANAKVDTSVLKIKDLIDYTLFLNPELPLTHEYCQKYADMDTAVLRYQSHKAYLVYWLYKKNDHDADAHTAYNGLSNCLALLWLVEAVGEDEATLNNAMMAALQAKEEKRIQMSTAFRNTIPFERIKELANHPKGWRLDPALTMLIDYRKNTYQPYIAKGCKTDFKRILRKEGIYFDE